MGFLCVHSLRQVAAVLASALAVASFAAGQPPSEFEMLQAFPRELLVEITAGGRPDAEGLVGHNKGRWNEAGMQRSAMWYLISAAVAGDAAKADDAWRAIDATFARQLDDGGFLANESAQEKHPTSRSSRVTTAFFWLQEMAHALLVLEQSPLGPRFSERIAKIAPRMRRAYDFISTDVDAIIQTHRKATNRLFIAAKAFGLGGVLLRDEKLVAVARRIVAVAAAQHDDNGVLLENGGADSSYNAVSLLFAQTLLCHVPDPKLDAVLDRAMAWELTQIDVATGEVSVKMNTRTGRGQETFMGKPKGVNYGEVALALCYYAQRKGRPELSALAQKVYRSPRTSPH